MKAKKLLSSTLMVCAGVLASAGASADPEYCAIVLVDPSGNTNCVPIFDVADPRSNFVTQSLIVAKEANDKEDKDE